jgi:hypothetical protein
VKGFCWTGDELLGTILDGDLFPTFTTRRRASATELSLSYSFQVRGLARNNFLASAMIRRTNFAPVAAVCFTGTVPDAVMYLRENRKESVHCKFFYMTVKAMLR